MNNRRSDGFHIKPDRRCAEPAEVSPAKPGAKRPMSTQKTRQAGRAIRPVRSVWIAEMKKARHLFQCEAFFIHFFAHPLSVLLIGGRFWLDITLPLAVLHSLL